MPHNFTPFRRRFHALGSVAACCVLATTPILTGCAKTPDGRESANETPVKAASLAPAEPARPAEPVAPAERQSTAAPNPAGQTQSKTPTATPTPTPTATADRPQAQLAPNLAPGTIARYSVLVQAEDRNELTGSMAARSIAVWEATLDVLIQVGEPNPAGLIPATVSLDRVRGEETMEERTTAFDSAEPPEKDPGNLIRPSLEGLVGKRIELDLDAQGRIVAARLPEELTRRHNPSTRWVTRLLRDSDIRAHFGPIFTTHFESGQTTHNQAASEHAATNPDSAKARRAHVGDAWITSHEEPFGSAGVSTTVTHTLEEVGNGSATISLNGTAVVTPSERVPVGLQRVTNESYKGSTRWDLSRGMLAEHDLVLFTEVQVRPEPEGFMISRLRIVQVRRVD